jgi:hypothetical protein
MNLEALKETIRQELPELLRRDPDFRSYILEITRGEFADRKETRDWFHETLAEMRREREKQDKKWDQHVEEQAQKWKLWQERWEVHDRRHQEEFNRVHEEIMALAKKHDRSIGALGARWGMQSERLIVISPMIDPQAQKLAEQLNIETYSDSVEVESLDSRSEALRE